MIWFYVKLAYRNIRSNGLVYGGSLLSVSLGALCIALLVSFVHNEFSMNRFHKRNKDIYVMMAQPSSKAEWQAVDASGYFRFDYKKYPELEKSVSLRKYNKEMLALSINKHMYYPEILVADSNFFKVFDFKLTIGDANTVLNNPNSVILTEKYACILFGNKNPMGQSVKISDGTERVYVVNGIAENPPSNSSITFDCILPYERYKFDKMGLNVILTKPNFDKEAFVKKIETICQFHPQYESGRLGIVPLNETYFNKGKDNQYLYVFSRYGDRKVCYILLIIVALLLFITTLNFTNLQVISVNSALKSLGINKINGAHRTQLIIGKCCELFILICISIIITSFLYIIILPFFNQITNGVLAPSMMHTIVLNAAIVALISFIAVIYPLVIILRVPVLSTLKKQVFAPKYLISQKVIITFQYVLAIVLLISTIIVSRQLSMMLNKDLGFTSNSVVSVKFFTRIRSFQGMANGEYNKKDSLQKSNIQYVNQELASSPFIETFSLGDSPLKPYSMGSKIENGTEDYTVQNWLSVSPGYADVFGLKLMKGRFFNSDMDKNGEYKVVVNEAALKYWNIRQIDGEYILNSSWNDGKYKIIGVVRDFNYAHLSSSTQPMVMNNLTFVESEYLIRFNKARVKEGLNFVRSLYNKVNPDQTFTYQFIDDEISALYLKEKQLSRVYILFTFIALIITSIGLFTIALYDTQRLTKEIGIRKVNGARTAEVMAMLNKGFIRWVAIAFVIACPIAWYAMHKWLQNFAYKTTLSWWVFAAAGVIALAIALLTVSWQSWRAARRNPVESLRYE